MGIPSVQKTDMVPSTQQLSSEVVLAGVVAIIFLCFSATAAVLRQRKSHGESDGSDTSVQTTPQPSEFRTKSRHHGRALVALCCTLSLILLGWLALQRSEVQHWVKSQTGSPSMSSCSPPTAQQRLDLYKTMTQVTFNIASNRPEVQQLFKQGLLYAFDFNQPEALRSFQAASDLDPTCTMCHWGISYALGPNINKVIAPEGSGYPHFTAEEHQGALRSAQHAQHLAQQALESGQQHQMSLSKEAAYCNALAHRFSFNHNDDEERDALVGFAREMARIGRQWKDATALALSSESYMIAYSWDYYSSTGRLRPEIETAEQLIDEAMAVECNNTSCAGHALLLHLKIHVSEADTPERASRAVAAADSLSGSFPHLGHLLHMPAHTYMRIGRYSDCVAVSRDSISRDVAAASACLQPYLPTHNLDMMVYCASMAGQLSTAQQYAVMLQDAQQLYPTVPLIADLSTLVLLWVRHAAWPEITSFSIPAFNELSEIALWQNVVLLYARFMAAVAAAAGKLPVQEAARPSTDHLRSSLAALEAAAAKVPYDTPTRPGQGLGIYSAASKNSTALLVLSAHARLAVLSGSYAEAAHKLQMAVELDDGFGYIEPPRTLQPPRQCLGWVLMKSGRFQDSEAVYEADLDRVPHNMWSLLGLQQLYEKQGRLDHASEMQGKFDAAWGVAEEAPGLHSSCMAFSVVA